MAVSNDRKTRRILGHARCLAGKELSAIKRIYPDDYARILKFFPEAQAGVLQYGAYKRGEN